MSYNINHSEYLSGELSITGANAKKANSFLARNWAECSFLNEGDIPEEPEDDKVYTIAKPWWYGEGSGRAYDILRDKILPLTRGTADLLFTWEGGDSVSGLRVVDGKVTEHEVIQTLGKVQK